MARVVFMGTPDFAVPSLRALIEHHEVAGVITQPDRPAGRRQELQSPPVKVLAQSAGLPVSQPHRLRQNNEVLDLLRGWQPELVVVAAFGQILPQEVLDIPPRGSINVHASLLPRWRGAAPIQAAIRAGDPITGITIMLMDAGLDTGNMLSQGTVVIGPTETAQSLHDRLSLLGADLLIHTLPGYLNGSIHPTPQDESLATYAPQIRKEDGLIDWTQDAAHIERQVRAFTPWPGTYTYWQSRQLKIHAGHTGEGSAAPGQVQQQDGSIVIGTGEGLFYPTLVQLAGKKAASIEDFVHGHHDFVGAVLDGSET